MPQPHESMDIADADVGPNYLHTMQIPLVAGRDFTDQDNQTSQRVVIVNEAFVHRYWPNQDGVGKRAHVDGEWATIVGVTRKGSYYSLRDASLPFIYNPMLQDYSTLRWCICACPESAELRRGGGKSHSRIEREHAGL